MQYSALPRDWTVPVSVVQGGLAVLAFLRFRQGVGTAFAQPGAFDPNAMQGGQGAPPPAGGFQGVAMPTQPAPVQPAWGAPPQQGYQPAAY